MVTFTNSNGLDKILHNAAFLSESAIFAGTKATFSHRNTIFG